MEEDRENREEKPRENAVMLHAGEACEEIPMEQIAVILGKPELIPVPGAPEGMAGLLEWKGCLAAVRYLEGDGCKDAFQYAVLVKKKDGGLLGILAERLTGGDMLDPFYR